MQIAQILNNANEHRKDNQKFLKQLKLKNSRKLDDAVHEAHHNVFATVDCLTCANCCKTTSPIFYRKDIDRLAKALRIKASDFEERYLKMDSDGDWVLQTAPCPFLDDENYCTVYENRPNACKDYPHTDRKNFYQITELTYKNTFVCPAVSLILEEVKASNL